MCLRRLSKINAGRSNPPGSADDGESKRGFPLPNRSVFILMEAMRGVGSCPARDEQSQDETVQSTSMFKTMSLALLAGASFFAASTGSGGGDRRRRFQRADGHLRCTAGASARRCEPPMPTAPGMGGGFIEFLFGGGPQGTQRGSPSRPSISSSRHLRAAARPMRPQTSAPEPEEAERRHAASARSEI